ncbi:GNAT family N-acetyltransferase [Shewanella waksmanii]|uniref:GNAT family N-acetyltransferase n=1 Tax=Shewanella waksmanii TaxID=213783 RepID=UPI0037350126
MRISVGDLTHPQVIALLEEHLQDMHSTSPAESVHALDLTELKQSSVTFWTLWQGDQLAGCAAVKQLTPEHGEIKSMRTATAFRQQKVAATLLKHLLRQAKSRGYQRLSLETGSMDFFIPARKLYQSFGFEECGPFADYQLDPNSVFMTKLVAV